MSSLTLRRCIRTSTARNARYIRSNARAIPNDHKREQEQDPVQQPRALGLATPKELVEYLNQFIVGQDSAKKVLSVAVFNHYNRVRVNRTFKEGFNNRRPTSFSSSNNSITQTGASSARLKPLRPRIHDSHPPPPQFPIPAQLIEKSNVLVIGPTGSGKTLLARTLAQVLDVPFSVNDANAFTQAGYVGEDVEMTIHRLLQAANWDADRASMGICYIDEIDKIARKSGGVGPDASRDVGGEGVQQALLRMMEGTTITIHPKGSASDDVPPPPPPSIIEEETPRSHQNTSTFSSPPGRSEAYHIDTSNILFVLSGAFVGLDNIIQSRVAKGSIGFGAELASQPARKPGLPFFTPNHHSGTNNALGLVETQDLIKYGFIPEFISRLPSVTTLSPLTVADLRRILSDIKGSLLSQYSSLFSYSGIEIQFTQSAQQEICRLAHSQGGGARGLRAIMEKLLLEPMFEAPGSDISFVLINEDVVRGHPPLYWKKDEGIRFWQTFAQEEQDYRNRRAASS